MAAVRNTGVPDVMPRPTTRERAPRGASVRRFRNRNLDAKAFSGCPSRQEGLKSKEGRGLWLIRPRETPLPACARGPNPGRCCLNDAHSAP
jgi:hypothetical protein